MNNFQTDEFLNVAKDKNQDDVDSQLFLKAMQNPTKGKRWLAALGAWMVAKGEKMQARYTTALRTKSLEFPLNKVKKARAH